VTTTLYSTGFPGGIFNSGFAASWIAQRIADAQPAPAGGETYAKALIGEGTRQCLANQALRLQMQNIDVLLRRGSHYTPALYDQRSPQLWARHIDVPVFLSGALQDTETGPQWPDMIPALSHDPTVWVTMVNGTHVDSIGPGAISRWVEFLDLYVADRLPSISPIVTSLSGLLYKYIADGAPSEPFPPLQDTNAPSVAAARVDYTRQNARITVLFDNGGGSAGPGAFQPVWQAGFTSWPPPRAVATTFDLGSDGRLTTTRAKKPSTVSFRPDPAARPATDLAASANSFAALPPYDWTPVVGSEGLGFISPVLKQSLVVVGPASLDLMLKSTALDTDLQATVSEVLPDGQEMYVQSGFLRASDRALDGAASTATHPVPTYLAATARSLPRGRFTLVRVPIDPIGFAFRSGSRIRITITAPGGTRPEWAFDTYRTHGRVVDTVELGGARPSSLVLSVVPGIQPPDPQPACPSLRGEPCRTYVPAGNGG
jgi:hypothetical protein